MPSASDAVARAVRLLQSRGGSGSCDAGLQAAAAGHLEQVAPRASIDALSDELLRGWQARACLPPPGVAGEPATSVEGRTCSDPASMPARTVSDQKGRANGGRAGAGARRSDSKVTLLSASKSFLELSAKLCHFQYSK